MALLLNQLPLNVFNTHSMHRPVHPEPVINLSFAYQVMTSYNPFHYKRTQNVYSDDMVETHLPRMTAETKKTSWDSGPIDYTLYWILSPTPSMAADRFPTFSHSQFPLCRQWGWCPHPFRKWLKSARECPVRVNSQGKTPFLNPKMDPEIKAQ